jgi:hypothetical protein
LANRGPEGKAGHCRARDNVVSGGIEGRQQAARDHVVDQRQRGNMGSSFLGYDYQIGQAGPTPARLSRYPHAGGPGLAESIPAILVETQRMSSPDPRGPGPVGEKRTEDPPDGLLITVQT